MHAQRAICAISVAIVLTSWVAVGSEIGRVRRNLEPAALPGACGESWVAVNPPPTGSFLSAVAWTGTRFVAVGGDGAIVTSPDGVTWTTVDSTPPVSLTGVVWTGTQLVAVGAKGAIVTSPDAVHWTLRDSGTSNDLFGVTWTGERLVAVGSRLEIFDEEVATILTSPDGIVWTSPTSMSYPGLYKVIWAGNQLVAVGAYTPAGPGAILTSPDGAIWTSRDSATNYPILSVDWSGTQFVAVGRSRSITTSSDAITWTLRDPGVWATLSDVTWTGSQHVAVGESGAILTSPDGVTWTAQSSDTIRYLSGVVWTGSQLVAVGDRGTIVRSACEGTCSAPVITAQPENVTVSPGQQATLTVTAGGTAPVTYQWYLGLAGETTIPVGTDSSTFSTTPLAGVARYWVRVSNACGHADSQSATVSAGWAVRRHLRAR